MKFTQYLFLYHLYLYYFLLILNKKVKTTIWRSFLFLIRTDEREDTSSLLFYLSTMSVTVKIIFSWWFLLDIDECAIGTHDCENGQCVNTEGNYICDNLPPCTKGFIRDPLSKRCVGKFLFNNYLFSYNAVAEW